MALALNGTPTSATSTTTAQALGAITTTLPAVWCCVVKVTIGWVKTITDTAGLKWNKRAYESNVNDSIELWYAIADTSKAGNVITVNLNTSAVVAATGFAVSGVDLTYPWDRNALLPYGAVSGVLAATTTAADTFIIGGYRFNATGNPTAGAGFTTIAGSNFLLSEYKIVASPQAALSVAVGTGAGDQTGGVCHALVADGQGVYGLDIDGWVHGKNDTSPLALPALSTNNPCIVVVVSATHGSTVSSIANSGTALTWARRGGITDASPFDLEIWWAKSLVPLSSCVITVTYTGGTDFNSVDAFGVSGADMTSPWDVNGTLPKTATATTITGLSTTATNTLIIGNYLENFGYSREGAGFDLLYGNDFHLTEYQVVSSAQSGISIPGTFPGGIYLGIADAIVQGTAPIDTIYELGIDPQMVKLFII